MISLSTPELRLRLGEHSIQVLLHPGAIAELPEVLNEHNIDCPAFVVDAAVWNLLRDRLAAVVTRRKGVVVAVTACEADKDLARVGRIAKQASQTTGVVAIGGGTIGNLAGFLAHLLRFGRPLVHVPTTVAAMVDAAISARHSLNTGEHKSVLGVHHAPVAVLADPLLLRSLPPSGWQAGAIEAVKAALIGGEHDAELLAQRFAELSSPTEDAACLTEVLSEAIVLKARLLASDPYENGPALALHYGHTLARALEAYSGYVVKHGPAVATGIMLAARVATALGLLSEGRSRQHHAHAQAACPPAVVSTPDIEALVELMAADPKRRYVRANGVPLVLPTDCGTAHHPDAAETPVTPVNRQLVRDVLADLAHDDR
jgi:3-dehydroquinate synthase/2-deoxy-scyllo-inosose synthase